MLEYAIIIIRNHLRSTRSECGAHSFWVVGFRVQGFRGLGFRVWGLEVEGFRGLV